MNTVLFGFDLVVIFTAILKLATEVFGLSAKVVRYAGAVLVGVAVLIVGLQAQGVILGPETEAWVVLILNTVTAILATLGFGSEAIGLATAVVDLARLKAVSTYCSMLVEKSSDKDALRERLDKVLARYGFL